MQIPPIEVSSADLRALQLSDLLVGAQLHECRSFALRLLDAARTERSAGRDPPSALTLLALVFGFEFDPGNNREPFRTHCWFGDVGPDDIAPSNYQALEEWLPEIEDAEIAARIADLLWTTRRGRSPAHEHGRVAVTKYVAAAQTLSDEHLNWPIVRDRLKRAMVLALKFDMEESVLDAIEFILRKQGDAPGHRAAALMELLVECGTDRAVNWMPSARRLAEQAEAEGLAGSWGAPGFGLARRYWEIIARYWDFAPQGDEEQGKAAASARRDARTRAAQTSILEADKARDANQPMSEAHFLEEAIRDLRAAGVTDQVDVLIRRTMDAQQRTPMKQFRTQIDVSEQAMAGARAVAGKTFKDALLQLGFIVASPTQSSLREMAREHLATSIAGRIASIQIMSRDARRVAHRPAMKGAELDEVEDAALVEYEMRQSLGWIRPQAFAYIEGARRKIVLEHRVTLEEVLPFVRQNPLVPSGHELQFARGFYLGFHGDFITACHLLVPQLENGLRTFVETRLHRNLVRQGDDGTQMVGLLGRVLDVPELIAILGEDLIFDLRAILIEQDHANLRNDMAHGLIPDGGYGYYAMYTWWLCIRISFLLLTYEFRNSSKEEE